MEEKSKPQIKCPMCGNEKFDPGKVQGHYTFKFKSEDCNLLEKATVLGGMNTRALCCKKCGFLAIFAEMPNNVFDDEMLSDEILDIRIQDDEMPDDKICL